MWPFNRPTKKYRINIIAGCLRMRRDELFKIGKDLTASDRSDRTKINTARVRIARAIKDIDNTLRSLG